VAGSGRARHRGFREALGFNKGATNLSLGSGAVASNKICLCYPITISTIMLMLVFIIQWKVTLPSGKLAMARRDSLQDFETTPRPLLFAPPLLFPPKETITSSQPCMAFSKAGFSSHQLSLRRSPLPPTATAELSQLLSEEPEQS
jgi:hypothetical protein